MKKPEFKIYFQNSCSYVSVASFTPSNNGGKQSFTITGYVVLDYFDIGDILYFDYSGSEFSYAITDISGSQITISLDYNASITNINTTIRLMAKTEANPINFQKCKFQWDKDSVNYYYRLKFSGKIIFKNDDYIYLKTALEAGCCRANVKIYKLCGGEYSIYYRSEINKTEGQWNESKCTFETELPPVDKYSCIVAMQGEEKNLYELDTDFAGYLRDDERDGRHEPFFEYLVRAVAPVAPGTVYTPPSGDDYIQVNGYGGYVNDPNTGNPWTLFVRYVRVIYYTTSDPFNFVPVTPSGYTMDTIDYQDGRVIIRWTKKVVTADAPEIISETNGTGGDCVFIGTNAMAIYDPINDNCIYVLNPSNVTIETYNSVSLTDSLGLFANLCNNISGVTSDFFEIDPIGDAPDYFAGDNYVTLSTNYVNNLRLSQITDITINGGSFASSLPATFKGLMQDLNFMFNVFWFIDSESRLRIEHEKYFVNNLIVDVSGLDYNKHLKEYTYIQEEIPNREKFTFKLGLNIDFVGTDIVYPESCSNKPVSFSRNSLMTTDIHFLRNNPDIAGTDGMVMLCCDILGGNQVIYEIGLLTGIPLQNNHLSWANLQYHYHRYGRLLQTGKMNFNNETFTTFKKLRKQNNQKFIGCCLDIPENRGSIITELGTGDATRIVYDINTSTFGFELNI